MALPVPSAGSSESLIGDIKGSLLEIANDNLLYDRLIKHDEQLVQQREEFERNEHITDIDDRIVDMNVALVDKLDTLNTSIVQGNGVLLDLLNISVDQLSEQKRQAFLAKEAALEASRKQNNMLYTPSATTSTAGKEVADTSGLFSGLGLGVDDLALAAGGAAATAAAAKKVKASVAQKPGMVTAKSGRQYSTSSPQGKMILTKGGTQPISPTPTAAPSATPAPAAGASKLGVLGKATKFLKGVPGFMVVAPLLEAAAIAQSEQMTEEQKTKEYFGVGGSMAGAAGGALAGSVFGPVGTVVGGIIGALGGEKLVESIFESSTGTASPEQVQREAEMEDITQSFDSFDMPEAAPQSSAGVSNNLSAASVSEPPPISYEDAAAMSPQQLKERGYIDFADQDDKNDFLTELEMKSGGVRANTRIESAEYGPVPRQTGATINQSSQDVAAQSSQPIVVNAPSDNKQITTNNTVVNKSDRMVQPRNAEPSLNSALHSGFGVMP